MEAATGKVSTSDVIKKEAVNIYSVNYWYTENKHGRTNKMKINTSHGLIETDLRHSFSKNIDFSGKRNAYIVTTISGKLFDNERKWICLYEIFNEFNCPEIR